MCVNLKLYLFLLVLVFSLSYPLFSDVVLTDQEYQIVMDSLIESQKEIKLLKQDSMILTAVLNRELRRVEILQKEQAILKLNLDLQSKSYEKLKKRVNLIWLDRLGFGLGGGILGGLAGYGLNALVP